MVTLSWPNLHNLKIRKHGGRKMNYEKLANDILSLIGGKNNVSRLTHCITRLRFNLKDESKADETKLKELDGVIGIIKQNGQFQVIIGNDVDKVFDILMPKLNLKNINSVNTKKVGIFSQVIDAVSSILSPLIPPLAAAGMIKVLLLILTMINILSSESGTYTVLNMVADAVFYFMPLLVAYSAAEKFNCNRVMAIALAGILIHPTYTALIGVEDASLSFLGITIPLVKYNATVLPTLMMVWFMSYVEHFAEKISPKVIKVFFQPLLVMLIVAPVTYIVIGPIGNYAGTLLASVISAVQAEANWLAVAILSSVYSLLVMVGMHRALTPIGLSLFTSLGYEPLMKAASLCSNFSQAASCLAVACKTKNKELKQIAGSAATTAFVSGITEPAMYGITLKLKRPLIACIISSAIAGIYAGLVGVKAYAYATPGIFSFAMFMGPDGSNIIHAIIAALIAIIGAFVLTWLFGFEEPEEDINDDVIEMVEGNAVCEITSPVKGRIIPLKDVNDDTFTSGVVGDGIAVYPEDDIICSPVDGRVCVVFQTKHALMIRSENGCEVLLHIGIDTVNLEGKYFKTLINVNDTVKKGDPLVKIDRESIKKEGYDLTTCVLVTNMDQYSGINKTKNSIVSKGEYLMNTMEKKL